MKLRHTFILSLLSVALVMPMAFAAEKAENEPSLVAVPEPPPIPKKLESGETLEPTVTIKEEDNKTIEEYSVNGRIYAVRITPKGGTPYYLVDVDGNGSLDSRRDSLDPNFLVNNWVLFSW